MPTNHTKLRQLQNTEASIITYNVYSNGYKIVKEALVLGIEELAGNIKFSRIFIRDILLYDELGHPVLDADDGGYVYLGDVKSIRTVGTGE